MGELVEERFPVQSILGGMGADLTVYQFGLTGCNPESVGEAIALEGGAGDLTGSFGFAVAGAAAEGEDGRRFGIGEQVEGSLDESIAAVKLAAALVRDVDTVEGFGLKRFSRGKGIGIGDFLPGHADRLANTFEIILADGLTAPEAIHGRARNLSGVEPITFGAMPATFLAGCVEALDSDLGGSNVVHGLGKDGLLLGCARDEANETANETPDEAMDSEKKITLKSI